MSYSTVAHYCVINRASASLWKTSRLKNHIAKLKGNSVRNFLLLNFIIQCTVRNVFCFLHNWFSINVFEVYAVIQLSWLPASLVGKQKRYGKQNSAVLTVCDNQIIPRRTRRSCEPALKSLLSSQRSSNPSLWHSATSSKGQMFDLANVSLAHLLIPVNAGLCWLTSTMWFRLVCSLHEYFLWW